MRRVVATASSDAVVGREAELTDLLAFLDDARDGHPRTVLVDGPPGIGKSTLLRRFVARATDVLVLDASGDEPERTTPYGVVEQLLRSSPAVHDEALDAIIRPPLADPPTVGAALVDLVGGLVRYTPVVVVVDDLQWVDPSSLQALGFVLRRLRGERVLVVLAVASDHLGHLPHGLLDVAEGHRGARRSLHGLAVSDLTVLASRFGHGDRSAAVARRLHRDTAGNPLHARALLEELEDAELETNIGEIPLHAPRSFAALVRERFADASDEVRRLVVAAAVLGPTSTLDQAARLADVESPLGVIQQAADARLLIARHDMDGTVARFPHALVRAAVYHDLGPADLAVLHRRAAEVVDDEGAAVQHLAAATVTDAGVTRRCVRFAEREGRRGAWDAAAAALLLAARTAPVRDDRERHVLEAIGCALLAGDAATIAELAPRIDGFRDGARRRYVVAQLALMRGDWPAGRRGLEEAWAADDRDADPQLAGRIAAAMANLCVNLGYGPEAVRWARRALELRGPRADLGGEVTSMLLFGLALAGEIGDGLRIAERCLADRRATTVERIGARLGRGVLRLWDGDARTAADDLREAYEASRTSGPFHTGHIALLYLADAEYRLGRWDDAIQHAEAAVTATSAAEQVWFAALVHAVAAFPLAARGRFGDAEHHVRHATEAAARIGHTGAYVWSATAAARLAHARGDDAAVVAILDELGGRLRDLGVAEPVAPGIQPSSVLHAEALARCGDHVRARRHLDDLERDDRVVGGEVEIGRVRALLADLTGRREDAEVAFREAVAALDEQVAPFTRAQLLLDHGRFLRRIGQRRNARLQLTAAAEQLAALGATPYLERCDRELHACGGSVGRGRDQPLTPQEAAVVELVAAGATNREVALRLHVTVKGVEYHLSNVYRKLGLRSRAQLAALVAGRDDRPRSFDAASSGPATGFP